MSEFLTTLGNALTYGGMVTIIGLLVVFFLFYLVCRVDKLVEFINSIPLRIVFSQHIPYQKPCCIFFLFISLIMLYNFFKLLPVISSSL